MGYKRLRGVTRTYRGLQWVTGVYKGLEEKCRTLDGRTVEQSWWKSGTEMVEQ